MPVARDAAPGPALKTSPRELALLLVSPLLAYALMNFQLVMQNGFLDPYIYTGYIHNFEDLFERYGATYYGVRFGTIIPGQIATALFGPIGGYLVLRYVLALVAGLPFYALVRQYYGRAAAVTMLGLLLTSPFLARALFWDYPDSTGVPFLFAAICLYSIEHPRRRLLDGAAGVLAGLAAHSNVFTMAPLSLFFGVHAVLWLAWRRPVGEVVRRLLTIAAGIAAVSLLGATYYGLRVGLWDIFSITANMSLWLTNGGLANWRVAGIEWVARLWWVLTPVFLIVLALLVRAGRRVTFEAALFWTSATVVTVFYYAYQFVFNGTFLQLFYYFSYILPFVFLLITLVVAGLLDRMAPDTQWRYVALLLTSAIAPWVLYSFERDYLLPARLDQYLAIVAVTIAFIVAARTAVARPAMMAIATAAVGLMFAGSFAGPRTSPSMFKGAIDSRLHPNRNEMDVYRVALAFMKAVPPLAAQPGTILFWYSNEPPSNAMQSIQSTYLWGYSKVQGDGPGLPSLNDEETKAIREPGIRWLGLLAEREEQLALARAALLDHEIPYTSVERRSVSAGAYTLHIELLDLQKNQ